MIRSEYEVDLQKQLNMMLNSMGQIDDDNGAWEKLPVFFPNRRKLIPHPYSFWQDVGYTTRRIFLHHHAQYFLPTLESMLFLHDMISDVEKEDCIEIGAGNGWLGFMLHIRMTDSYLQENPEIKQLYALGGQPVIKYGADVENIDAVSAVKKYKPHTVIASWVSQFGNPPLGNPNGIDELEMMKHCKRFIFIGTDTQHSYKALIKSGKYKKHRFEGLISRSKDDAENAIWVFDSQDFF